MRCNILLLRDLPSEDERQLRKIVQDKPMLACQSSLPFPDA